MMTMTVTVDVTYKVLYMVTVFLTGLTVFNFGETNSMTRRH